MVWHYCSLTELWTMSWREEYSVLTSEADYPDEGVSGVHPSGPGDQGTAAIALTRVLAASSKTWTSKRREHLLSNGGRVKTCTDHLVWDDSSIIRICGVADTIRHWRHLDILESVGDGSSTWNRAPTRHHGVCPALVGELLRKKNTKGRVKKKVKTWWNIPSSGWPPPPLMMEIFFIIFWALDHFLRPSWKKWNFHPEMPNEMYLNIAF